MFNATREIFDQFVEFLSLAIAAGNQQNVLLNRLQRDDRRVYVGSLGIVVICNFGVDILYSIIDPRIKTKR